jgi:hypothetical protein
MSGLISGNYRRTAMLENRLYSMWKLIGFSAFSVAVRRSLTAASEALISWGYRSRVSGTEKLSIFQWKPYKALPLFRICVDSHSDFCSLRGRKISGKP